MLASIIDRLTSLVSKYLVIGFLVPVLLFTFIISMVLYHHFNWFREWARPETSGTERIFDAVVVLIGLSILAYLFSAVSTFLREILEGKHLLEYFPWLMRRLQARQQDKLKIIQSAYEKARGERKAIVANRMLRIHRLSDAASTGRTGKSGVAFVSAASHSFPKIETLKQLRSASRGISSADLAEAVDLLAKDLSVADESAKDVAGNQPLFELWRDALKLGDYAEDYWSSEELRLFNERQSRFGLSYVAPTALGNVALTMQAYAITRYKLNLEKFWGDLQATLQVNAREFYAQLQDAKTQLDFLVTCCWLSVLSTIGCVSIAATDRESVVLFLILALGGPCVVYFFYFLAAKSYRSFAELVRIGVDLYRFHLLDCLHIARPRTVRDEWEVWTALQRLSQPGPEGIELSYKADGIAGQ